MVVQHIIIYHHLIGKEVAYNINYFTFDAIMDLNTSISNFKTMQGNEDNKCSIMNLI